MLEIKNIIIELKNSFEGLIYLINAIKEWINENENSSINIAQKKIQKKKKKVEKKENTA